MRGFLIITAIVLAVIAIGVTVESLDPPSSPTSAVPVVVAQSISSTMAVKSVEVTQNFPEPNRVILTGTGIYNAPDLWQGPYSLTAGQVQTQAIWIGDSEYAVARGRGPGLNALLEMHQPISTLHSEDGMSPAQMMAFSPLTAALHGSGFRDVSGVWMFHLHLGLSSARLTAGTIEIAGGVINKATTIEVLNGHVITLSYTYSQFNSAPHILIPAVAKASH